MDDVKEKLILGKLKNIQNVATLMKDYFKPFDLLVEDKKYTINEISRHANTVLPGHCFVRTDNLTPDYEYLKKEGLIA